MSIRPSREYYPRQNFRLMARIIRASGVYHVAGTSSIYIPSSQRKVIDRDACVEWQDISGDTYPMTPGEIARTELKREFPNVKKTGFLKAHMGLLNLTWPRYYEGQFHGDGTYIDLTGAYLQIYRVLWLDTRFPRGKGKLPLWNVAANIGRVKSARNSLIGIVRSTSTWAWRGGKKFLRRMNNPYLNPELWATVQYILHEIAHVALLHGAVYVATDGYLFPTHEEGKAFAQWLDYCGLGYRVRYGELSIRGWGAYRLGGYKQTRLFDRTTHEGTGINYIELYRDDQPLYFLPWWKVLNDEREKDNA